MMDACLTATECQWSNRMLTGSQELGGALLQHYLSGWIKKCIFFFNQDFFLGGFLVPTDTCVRLGPHSCKKYYNDA